MAGIQKIEGKRGVSYKITVFCGEDATGRQIRHFKTWKPEPGQSPRQIEKALQKAAYEFEEDIKLGYMADNKITFRQYTEHFVDVKEVEGIAPGTRKLYEQVFARAFQVFGDKKMVDIRPHHISALYKSMMQPGSMKGTTRARPRPIFKNTYKSAYALQKMYDISKRAAINLMQETPIKISTAQKVLDAMGGEMSDYFTLENTDERLSNSTINRVADCLRTVFGLAEFEMLIKYNPVEKVKPPRDEHKPANYFQPEQIQQILTAADKEETRWRALVYLMAVTGARRGEILSLRWSDIDFNSNSVCIDSSVNYVSGYGKYEGSTKTRKNRSVIIPPQVTAILKAHKVYQTKRRFMLGDLWEDNDYIFPNETGGMLVPSAINGFFTRFSKRHNLPHINPHAFRHTAASILIASGIDVVTVANQLGHSSIHTTTDIYAHVIEESKQKASVCISNVILQKQA